MDEAKAVDIGLEELRQLRLLSRAVDDLLEESLKARENLQQTFRRIFPELLRLTGAKAIAVHTQAEDLTQQTYSEGEFGGVYPGTVLAENKWGVRRLAGSTLITQVLDVVGISVGTIGMLFDGDHTETHSAAKLTRVLDVIAEELDTVLASVQTAAEKHHLILKFNEHLANPVFEAGMDAAVAALAHRVKLPNFALLYRDAVEGERIHYRTYKHGRLEFESGNQPFPPLEQAIQRYGPELIGRTETKLRAALGVTRAAEAVLISGPVSADTLGKVILWSPDAEGFSAFTLDLVRVLASTLSQRLIDYNRERIHLSQFFPNRVIDELLDDPDYRRKYLTPRDESIGILFADINGFTRICEQVLESPANIGGFVDRWSEGVVRRVWDHGGVFDKMVGDCVIGLFGPPFFRSSPSERAEAAMRAARDIQKFTEAMSADKEVARLAEIVKLPGLGVAIGVNLAPTYCGMFGPNQNYTGFSTGMNQTARLQSLGGFRETLVMDSVRTALEKSNDPYFRSLEYGKLTETPVKNVSQPLRYYAVNFK